MEQVRLRHSPECHCGDLPSNFVSLKLVRYLNDRRILRAGFGHLVLSQGSGGVQVGFDADGLLGPQSATTLLTLEDHSLLHLDLAAILTAQTTS